MTEKYHFKSIDERNEVLGFPKPEHPLFDITRQHCHTDYYFCADFYSISLKEIISGEVVYGRTKYDCQSGTMIFISPNQEVKTRGIVVESDVRTISFHKDFLLGHPLSNKITNYHFFNYAVNEALHLSPREETIVNNIFDAIEVEYKNNYDDYTRDLILSHLNTLLKYADRFYHRQFLMRKEAETSIYTSFISKLNGIIDENVKSDYATMPQIEDLAQELHITPRYLSDALKAETGKTAKHWIQLTLLDRAKEYLLSSDDSIANIAYMLGFEYPQYFSRLFKNKIGKSPKDFREENK